MDTSMMEAALCTRGQGHRKHLQRKLTAKIRVGKWSIQFNPQATCWLGVWMDVDQTFQEHHNR